MEGEKKYDAVCAECGKSFKLKFKPTEGRPVYCDECFRKRRPQRSFGGHFGGSGYHSGGGGNRGNRNSRGHRDRGRY